MKLKELIKLIDKNQDVRINTSPLTCHRGLLDTLDLTTIDLNKEIKNIYTDYSELVIIY